MTGLVYKSTGSWYIVRDEQGQLWNARMKGVLKLDEITSTNPVAVGDRVSFEIESAASATAVIDEILPRHNYINRQSPRHKHQHHIVAANLDQTLLVATLKEPKTSQGFIDRFLVAAAMYHVTPLIVFNKADLYRQKEMDRYEALRSMYEAIGYRVLLVSAATGQGMDELLATLTGKTTLLSGHSGVGKSSLLNSWFPGMNRKTQDVSGWSGKGQHTTTFAEMFDLLQGGKIIDTPGMREFGLVDISKQELSHYFSEMKPLLQDCQFNNCLHYNEPGCAVKQAVQDGRIHEDRFISYLSILDSIEDKQY
ncbi:MAG: ribosome small subunit-dependent GTPase A [Chitinophagales bacterium]|jgi:ribosome biogenesis GTPase|nr:ribosome small subunit-dependent GTPase A [Chitinophagales bacterium]